MADKEERILCNSYDGIQAQLMANNNIGMTRQEAIEVMAKEIYKKMWIESECKNKNTIGFSICEDYAEIALNALLKGVNK